MSVVVVCVAIACIATACSGSEERPDVVTATLATAGSLASQAAGGPAPTTSPTADLPAPTTTPPAVTPATAAPLPPATLPADATRVELVTLNALPVTQTGRGECATGGFEVQCFVPSGPAAPDGDGTLYEHCVVRPGGTPIARCLIPLRLEAIDVTYQPSTRLGAAASEDQVVRIELETGVSCGSLGGTWSFLPTGERVTFVCSDETAVIGDLDTSGSRWKTTVVRAGVASPVSIVRAWRF